MIIRYTESIYKNDVKVPTCHGTREVDEFKLDHMKNGGVRLVKTGTKPLYEMIQANKVNCDLSSVLETCVHQNQLAVCDIDDVTQAIADFSGLSSMSDWYAGMKNLENVWSKMPLEAREQFNSSPTMFVNSISQPDFVDKIQKGYEAFSTAYKKRLDVSSVSDTTVVQPSSSDTTVVQPSSSDTTVVQPTEGDDK